MRITAVEALNGTPIGFTPRVEPSPSAAATPAPVAVDETIIVLGKKVVVRRRA